jgi:preprotein translocase subunit SecG
MKRAWLYLAFAVAIGLTLVLVPLITLANIRANDSLSAHLQSLEGNTSSGSAKNLNNEVDALAISFFVALAAYALLKRKTPRQPNRAFSPYPF